MTRLKSLSIKHDGDDETAGLVEEWRKTPEGFWRPLGSSTVRLDGEHDVSPGQLVGYANSLTKDSRAIVLCDDVVIGHGGVIRMEWDD